MVIRNYYIVALLVVLCPSLLAQQYNNQEVRNPFERAKLFRTTLTFATGYMPKNQLNNLYLTGNIEYYTDNHISLRGDGMYFFNSMNQDKTLKMNHSIFSGAAYHFGEGTFDPFIGIQTGLAYTQCGIVQQDQPPRGKSFSPLMSGIAGFNYYANKWFHLFINLRYSQGKLLSNEAIIPLNEWNVSFGLGFNVSCKRNTNKNY
jgi:hypothetical protein